MESTLNLLSSQEFEPILSKAVALLRRFFVPMGGYLTILRNAVAVFAHCAKHALRF